MNKPLGLLYENKSVCWAAVSTKALFLHDMKGVDFKMNLRHMVQKELQMLNM